MTGFVDRLHLKEKVEEDLYFARRDRELVSGRRSHATDDPASAETPQVIAGGQTGVDRAALDAALATGLATGGWCPLGHRAEDGPIPDRYGLRETPSAEYAERTAWNVRDSDATLILHQGPLTGGTRLTADLARRAGRPLLIRDLAEPIAPGAIADWLVANHVRVLNCAGPRESGAPGIQEASSPVLRDVFREWMERRACPRDSGGSKTRDRVLPSTD